MAKGSTDISFILCYLLFRQTMFLVFMITVALLLMNMFIAMMANTYQVISEAQDEWLRQVRFIG